jgi:epoxyqueuosine reductase
MNTKIEHLMRGLARPRLLKWAYLVPVRARRRRPGPDGSAVPLHIPPQLLSTPGIARDPAAEEEAFRRSPLHDFTQVHSEFALYSYAAQWRATIPAAPRMIRGFRAVAATAAEPVAAGPATESVPPDPAELTRAFKARAVEAGLSAVGIAPYDPKFTLAEYQDQWFGRTVVACALEKPFAETQTIPSGKAQRGAFNTYGDLMVAMAQLCTFLHERGYPAVAENTQGRMIVLHYAVAAGLGQLGLNGQVLTPFAGSRCAIAVLSTDAPLEHDQPADYGITGICDACRICVRRCPSGAITAQRQMHRGVAKAKISTRRCLPIVAEHQGCSICTKVCPVQRYGLAAVLEEYRTSGQILGKGSEELEGYDFKGEHFPVGRRPRVTAEDLAPPGLVFDPDRQQPLDPDDRSARYFG